MLVSKYDIYFYRFLIINSKFLTIKIKIINIVTLLKHNYSVFNKNFNCAFSYSNEFIMIHKSFLVIM